MALAPPRHEGTVQPAIGRGKGRARRAPALPDLSDQIAQPHELGLALQAELAPLVDAQERVPAQANDAPEQPAGVQAAVGQNQHRPVARDGRAQHPQHAQPLAAPRPLFARGHDGPRDRDATAAVDHTDRQDDETVAQAGRIERERDLLAAPEPNDPVQ